MPILNRTSLTPSDKLNLLAKSLVCQEHGVISHLANLFDISRKAVYKTRDAAQTALEALVSDDNEPGVLTSISVDKTHLRRTIVTLAMTAPNSIRAIEEQIPLFYPGCKVSYGYIQGVIIEAQQQAAKFNRRVPLSAVVSVAIDEMFSQGDPVLAGIDLDSGYLFCLSHESRRDGKTWQRVLQQAAAQGMQPQHVVKDGAKGIAKGVKDTFPNAEQRDDTFHAIYITGKAVRRAEQRAYYYIKLEEAAYKASNGKEADPSMTQQWLEAADKCDVAIERYENSARAFGRIRSALRCVCRQTGQLMTVEMAQAQLQAAVDDLRKAEHGECDKAARYVENRLSGLTLATDAVHKKLLILSQHYTQEQVELACRFWEAQRELVKAPHWKQPKLTTEQIDSYQRLTLQLDETKRESLIQGVEVVLLQRHRASSAIEGFNATLRPYLYARKGVNQGFLELFQAWHNLRERRWGRHKGTSAYESLTGETVTDWLTLLGFPPSKLHH